jgi:hypothetical protein
MAAINIKRAEFHGEWNYTITPNAHPQIARLFRDEPLGNTIGKWHITWLQFDNRREDNAEISIASR